ncbi:MAG: hypothetical protein KJ737_23160, partial [Proteobacteria bacterium]|nr:hypothetical protein [Pseudomonadota bacterium]
FNVQNFLEFARFEDKFTRAEDKIGGEFARSEIFNLHGLSENFARVLTPMAFGILNSLNSKY